LGAVVVSSIVYAGYSYEMKVMVSWLFPKMVSKRQVSCLMLCVKTSNVCHE